MPVSRYQAQKRKGTLITHFGIQCAVAMGSIVLTFITNGVCCLPDPAENSTPSTLTCEFSMTSRGNSATPTNCTSFAGRQ